MKAFDPLQILQVLDRHTVRFVVIGGIAGRLWGSTTVTNDLDICHARDRGNLEMLASSLQELKVKLRRVDRDAIRVTTVAGKLNSLESPAGSGGYDMLARTATTMDVGGVKVQVAAIEDLIRMKRAAGRPKDLIEVEVLAAVREELDRE
jgi:hypothetical protein